MKQLKSPYFFYPLAPILLTPTPLPMGISYSPRPRLQPVKLNNQHLWPHRKIGDCEQSKYTVWTVLYKLDKTACSWWQYYWVYYYCLIFKRAAWSHLPQTQIYSFLQMVQDQHCSGKRTKAELFSVGCNDNLCTRGFSRLKGNYSNHKLPFYGARPYKFAEWKTLIFYQVFWLAICQLAAITTSEWR